MLSQSEVNEMMRDRRVSGDTPPRPPSNLKATIILTGGQIREAITDYLAKNGYKAACGDIIFGSHEDSDTGVQVSAHVAAIPAK